MRLTDEQIQTILQLARQVMGRQRQVRVFDSWLDDVARYGNIDLMPELSEPIDNPAQLSSPVSRAMHERKVDVLLKQDPDLAKQVEAFVGKFGRLQDTAGDKLLPLLFSALGENHPPPSIVNFIACNKWVYPPLANRN